MRKRRQLILSLTVALIAVLTAPTVEVEKYPVQINNEVQQIPSMAIELPQLQQELAPVAVEKPIQSANTSAEDAKSIARAQVSPDQWTCLEKLWQKESGWRVSAYNASSGAQGIPQSLPGSKMASAGADWETNAATQIKWGLGYITARYGTPCAAWNHSQSFNWY